MNIGRMEQYLNKNDSMMVSAWSRRLAGEFEGNLEVCEKKKSVAGSSTFSARKVRMSTWLPAECDRMSDKE